VWLPVARSRLVRTGNAGRVLSSSQPPRSGQATSQPNELAGKVTFVGRNADAQTGNVAIHILVNNKDSTLVVGQTVSSEITIGEPVKTLCVPVGAVRDESEGSAITVIRDGKTTVLRPKLGVSDGAWIAVGGTDLKPGELVAVSGAYNLPEGTAVELDKESAAPAGTK
jgi:membrane fusion protein, multidrug efflux system